MGERSSPPSEHKKLFKAFDPDAVMLVPPSLDEWLPQNHLARFIAEIVSCELDLTRFYDSYAKTKGQPPYDPRLMVRVLARYTAKHRATGNPLNVRGAHHFIVRGGLIVRFEQFVDTAKVAEASQPTAN